MPTLRTVLVINAAFSAVSGLGVIVLAGSLAALFGSPSTLLFRGLGAGLLLFAADIGNECRRPSPRRGKALYFSLSDLGWVVGSVALLVAVPLAGPAQLLVALVAAIVAAFGTLQLRALRAAT